MAAAEVLARREPFQLQPLGGALEAILISSAIGAKDWFPDHTLATICPRGHEFGMGTANRPVSFDVTELGANLYRKVRGTAPGSIEADGLPTTGDPVGSLLLCGVCNAAWPIDYDVIEVEYV